MVRTVVVIVAGLALGFGAVARSALSRGTAQPRVTVSCDEAIQISTPATPGGSERVLFGRIALARENRVPKPVRRPGLRPFEFVAKSGFLVRHGRTPVDLIVPPTWRMRLGIGGASAVRILGCNSTPPDWRAYASVFTLRRPACVPLIVRVDGRSKKVWFAIGHPC